MQINVKHDSYHKVLFSGWSSQPPSQKVFIVSPYKTIKFN